MPLSFGVLLGLAVAAIGAVLWRMTSYRRTALAMLGTGIALALVTLLLIVLAVSAGM